MSHPSSHKDNPLVTTTTKESKQTKNEQLLRVSALRETLSLQGELLRKAQQCSNEKVGRECTNKILEAIGSFLESWEKRSDVAAWQEEDDEEDGEEGDDYYFPSSVVRDGLFLLLSEWGPDVQIRMFLLETLPTLQKVSTRQILLDVLPSTMPTALDDDVDDATRQVIQVMRQITLDDTDALLPVLECLSKLNLSMEGSVEAWNLALTLLPVVSEHDLTILVQTLLRHMTSDNDALRALEAVRVEIQLMEDSRTSGEDDRTSAKHGDAILWVADVLLNAIQDEDRKDISKAYLQILQRLAMNENTEEEQKESLSNKNGFLLLDIVVMLSLYGNEELKRDTEALIDTLLQYGRFPFEPLQQLLKAWGAGHKGRRKPTYLLYERTVPSLLSLAIWMLLVPVRDSVPLDVERILTDTHSFITELYHALDSERQEELIHCLLHLGDESLLVVSGKKRPRGHASHQNETIHRKYDTFKLSLEAGHRILQSLAVSCRGTLTKFKHVLISRLTSRDNHIDSNDTSTQHVCHILASLVEPTHSTTSRNGTGIDSSELMLLLQKLLFTSSHRQHHYLSELNEENATDTGRVIRGLNLATELVRSPFVSHGDKECIQQWVLRVLLPSTRQSVDADIGLCGLQFFAVWSEWYQGEFANRELANHQSGGDTFQHIKMILANTGLVQMVSHYKQRKKGHSHTVLGYTTVHPHFVPVEEVKVTMNEQNSSSQIMPQRRKKRDMVFCTTSFLRNMGIPHSSRWGQCTVWIFNLVDTYLKMGQEASSKTKSKWMPDGWLEAAIELPDLHLQSTIAAKQPEAPGDDWIQSHLKSFEVKLDNPSVLGLLAENLSSLTLPGNSMDDSRLHVENGYRLSLTLILSISTSLAVLRNAHDHYLRIKTSHGKSSHGTAGSTKEAMDGGRQSKLLGLLQYQVAKIHDMKHKCEICLEILHSYKLLIRKSMKWKTKNFPEKTRRREKVLGVRPMRGTDDQQNTTKCDSELDSIKGKRLLREIDIITIRARKLLSILFTSTDFIDPYILWDCLLDADEHKFRPFLPQITKGGVIHSAAQTTDKIANFHCEVDLRRSFVEHIAMTTLVRKYDSRTTKSDAGIDLSLASSYQAKVADETNAKSSPQRSLFGYCVKILSLLSPLLPELRRMEARRESSNETANLSYDCLSGLVYSYTNMIQILLTKSVIKESGPLLSVQSVEGHCSPFNRHILECKTYFGSDQVSQSSTPNNILHEISNTFDGFLEYVRICENSWIAMQLVDILSILALWGKPTLWKAALQASWKSLHTIYVSEVQFTSCTTPFSSSTSLPHQELPSVFLLVMDEFLTEPRHAPNHAKKAIKLDKVLIGTILKSANCHTKEFEEHSVLRNNLLAHWALMVKSSCFDDLMELIEFMEYFVSEFEQKTLRKTRATQEKRAEEEKDLDSPISPIPGLTVASLPVYFEILLHMVIATIAVWEPSRRRQKKGTPQRSSADSNRNGVTGKDASPYEDFENANKAFCRLVGMYMSKFKLFPKRMASVVFSACSQMMNVSTLQLHLCVEWRNVQPLLSWQEKKAGVHDHASIRYLQLLLDVVASNCPGAVLSLCEFVRSQASQGARKRNHRSNQEDDETYSIGLNGETWVFASHHKRITALALASEGVVVTLKEIASAHNLTAPTIPGSSTNQQELQDNTEKRKRKVKDRDRGFHEVAPIQKAVTDLNESVARPKKRLAPTLVTKDTKKIHSGTSSDESSILHNNKIIARKKHPVIEEESEEEDHEWMRDSDTSFVEAPKDDGDMSDSSSASFGVLGNWDQSEESSTGSLELEANDLFGRSSTGGE